MFLLKFVQQRTILLHNHPAGVETALAIIVFLKKCSCGFSAVRIFFHNERLKFPGNFDIKFKGSLVFTGKSGKVFIWVIC